MLEPFLTECQQGEFACLDGKRCGVKCDGSYDCYDRLGVFLESHLSLRFLHNLGSIQVHFSYNV